MSTHLVGVTLCAMIRPGFLLLLGDCMNKLITLLGLSLSMAMGSAFAADTAAAPAAPASKTAQQNKMTTCNKDAGEKALKGDARKAFMKDCLGAKPAAAEAPADKKTVQQEKMKSCNKEAADKALKGEPRKAFMKDCLSK
jgi:hypothetical protein